MDAQSQVIAVELSDGSIISVEATQIGEAQICSTSALPFSEMKAIIKSLTGDIASTMQEVKQVIQPDKMSIKIGLEVAVESGQLTAFLVKGSGKGNLEISMEWNK
ncbi:MAG: hypothetical protein JGK04_26570 [Microcoleus sp. PH2017_39_LGB_O_B]|uniref:CU044_2847 family protein n=1 Tax=unclassified Microcoleus TaxID=2642155 RepID=UPI001D4519A9|nr:MULTISPECIES: CU044_2847 family protein [unclassified Microcoleus]MCC3451008.1 hypothetical protein [Microcoleus sp. PH2017_09_SFU_O_A]MCC3631895.1 hypothetical protein [Microcoleus sp. PH2017_39_LGB_O_B]MCC3644061.1 hypothetical protein [Microcoleus sp. PH2017_33_LGB_O_A]TAF85858.1 MAG: hypothetical protein EAZ49_25285 [Oscillatoriales cyanobacterium]